MVSELENKTAVSKIKSDISLSNVAKKKGMETKNTSLNTREYIYIYRGKIVNSQ